MKQYLITLIMSVICNFGFGQVYLDSLPLFNNVAWWPFNGDAADMSGNGNDGLIFGATNTEDRFGNVNAAFSFDGIDDYILVQTESLIDSESDYTWSLWFNSLSSDYNGSFLSSYTWFCKLGHDLPGLFYKDEQGAQSNTWYIQNHFQLLPTSNNWHHLVIRKTFNLVELFLDGANIGGVTSYGHSNFSPTHTTKFGNTYNDYFEGQIDDIGVWNRSLSVNEIQLLFNSTSIKTGCLDPVACNFDSEANIHSNLCDYNGCSFCGPGTIWNDSLMQCVALPCPPSDQACGFGTTWDPVSQLCETNSNCHGDYTSDNIVGAADLLLFLTWFGQTCNEPVSNLWTCGNILEYQGYGYETVQIGEQCWFAENLRTSQYANGDSIPGSLSNEDWTSATTGAQTIYGEGESTVYLGSDDEIINLGKYGRLYNWFAITDQRHVCPAGWHIPSDTDWIDLESEIGLDENELFEFGFRGTNQGNALKSSSADNPEWDGTNAVGFSGLPGGTRNHVYGYFDGEGMQTHWWSSSLNDGTPIGRQLHSDYQSIERSIMNGVTWGLSVRCLLTQAN